MKKVVLQFKNLILLPVSLLSFCLFAQDGTLDNSFGLNGKARFAVPGLADQSNVLALQSDGKIVTAGPYTNGGSWDIVLVRLNYDGTPDNSFGTLGKVTTQVTAGNDVPYGIAIQSDGKIVVAGYGSNGTDVDVMIIRYNTDGSLDNSFDGDGIVLTNLGGGEIAYGIAIQPDGKIVLAGQANNPAEPAAFRYNSNGSLDNSFDGDGVVIFTGSPTNDGMRAGLALQTDGKIVMGGLDNYSGGNFHGELVRLNANGSPDNSFGTNGLVTFLGLPFSLFYAMTIQSDGKIIGTGAGATSTNPGSSGGLIVRFNSDGTIDNSFNGTGYNLLQIGYGSGVYGITQQSNGKLIGAGSARFADPVTSAITYDFSITRYNTDGTFDNAFDGDGVKVVQFGFNVDDGAGPILLQANGQYVAAGFVLNGSSQDFAVLRVNGDLSVLPVTLTSFTALKKNNSVELSWTTSSEQDNRGFEIQRSSDGTHYFPIGWRDGTPGSTILTTYSFTDTHPVKGGNFYRLKQIDLDNRSALSAIRKVDFGQWMAVSVYPNPVTDVLNVQLDKNITTIRIYDIHSRLVWQEQNTESKLSFSIPLKNISSGLYLLEVMDGHGNRQTERFIKH